MEGDVTKVEMTANTSYGIKKGKTTESIKLEKGTVVKCNQKVADELKKAGVAIDYVPVEKKEITI